MSSFLEIKHVATAVTNYKTRGQTGVITIDNKLIVTIMARAGNKISGSKKEQLLQLKQWYSAKDIEKNSYQTLVGVRDIMDTKNEIRDLVMVPRTTKVNLDYEYKRKLLDNGRTVPFQDMNEMYRYRGSSNYIRSKGERATKDKVDLSVQRAKQNVKASGTPTQFVIRHFLRALVQEIKPFIALNNFTYEGLAFILKNFGVSENQLKNAKRSPFKANVISNDARSRRLIRQMLNTLGYKEETYEQFYEILIFKGISNINDIGEDKDE